MTDKEIREIKDIYHIHDKSIGCVGEIQDIDLNKQTVAYKVYIRKSYNDEYVPRYLLRKISTNYPTDRFVCIENTFENIDLF